LQDSAVTEIDLECILRNAKTVAVVGASSKEDNPSHEVAEYLLEQGFRVFPVNPNCDEVLGQKCYPDLKSIDWAKTSLSKSQDTVHLVIVYRIFLFKMIARS